MFFRRACLRAFGLLLSFGLVNLSALAQDQPAASAPTLTVQSQLVLVPTEVRTKKGETIFGLHAEDFVIRADGVPQRVQMEDSGDPVPLSLVVLVQCARNAWREGPKTKGLSTMVEAIVGASPARVAVVDFGKELELLTGLTDDPGKRDAAFHRLEPCFDDPGAGIFDALSYANRLLDRDHATGRRIVLLVSETRDHGSLAKPASLIEALNRSNTMVEAVAFSPGRDAMIEDARTADGATGSIFGLVGMAIQALRKNAPKELARETGGQYINFASERGFDQSLNTLANRIHNGYELSFIPRFPSSSGGTNDGLHQITVEVPKYPDAVVQHRASYWSTSSVPAQP
ncbi:MAG TPA: VWA domain-containing protein [Acidobacteriaceae bacterium]|nr:VWA domain-containing protein [Acidobacteriaceae bacterium]